MRKVKYDESCDLHILQDIAKIKQMLEDHERRISKLEGKTNSISTKNVDMDAAQALGDLLKGSFFNEPRKYGQIIKQLKINATFSARIKYKRDLEILVKEKKLTRKMVDHQWVYNKNDK